MILQHNRLDASSIFSYKLWKQTKICSNIFVSPKNSLMLVFLGTDSKWNILNHTATGPDTWQSYCCLEAVDGLLQVALLLEYARLDQHVHWVFSHLHSVAAQSNTKTVMEKKITHLEIRSLCRKFPFPSSQNHTQKISEEKGFDLCFPSFASLPFWGSTMIPNRVWGSKCTLWLVATFSVIYVQYK